MFRLVRSWDSPGDSPGLPFRPVEGGSWTCTGERAGKLQGGVMRDTTHRAGFTSRESLQPGQYRGQLHVRATALRASGLPRPRRPGQSFSPQGGLLPVSVGLVHTCRIRRNGTLTCSGTTRTPGFDTSRSVRAGGARSHYTPRLRRNGTVACCKHDLFRYRSSPDSKLPTQTGWQHSRGTPPGRCVFVPRGHDPASAVASRGVLRNVSVGWEHTRGSHSGWSAGVLGFNA